MATPSTKTSPRGAKAAATKPAKASATPVKTAQKKPAAQAKRGDLKGPCEWARVGPKVSDFHADVWGDSSGRVWVVGQVWGGRKGVLFSDDHGHSWIPQDRPNKHDLCSVCGDGEGTVWAVGYEGTVLRHTIADGVWKRARAGIEGRLESVICRSPFEIFVGSQAGTIHRSADGGKQWAQVFDWGKGLRRLAPGHGGSVVAIGEKGLLLSRDGVTWDALSLPLKVHDAPFKNGLTAFSISPEGHLYAGGPQGDLFRSRDQGANWEHLRLPLKGNKEPINGIRAGSAGALLVASLTHVFSSEDGGEGWALERRTSAPEGHAWHYALWQSGDGADAVIIGPHGNIFVRQASVP